VLVFEIATALVVKCINIIGIYSKYLVKQGYSFLLLAEVLESKAFAVKCINITGVYSKDLVK
jgi:hypothetical protein